jgi:hemoglobin
MDTRKDIQNREDIDHFIRAFYEKVKLDETIGIVFTSVVKMDWEHHIPLITDFWETILLDHPVYQKNAMEVHYHLNKIFPLKKEHFDAWLSLFNTTIDGMFSGPVTELAKKRAAGIAGLMQYKMNNASI